MEVANKQLILCVDDEPQVLEGLALSLGRRYQFERATSGSAALAILAREPETAVVVSDMRMPGMDGAKFLAQARQLLPDAVRILLTGQADVDSAMAAVNEGQIFRFLTKPCPPATLLAAVGAGVEQHQLITAERVLLQQTLHGCINALTDVLALANPAAFGRATRLKALVSELADKLGIRERWQVEIAAMLSQIGFIALPAKTVEAIYFGKTLSPEEEKLVAQLPATTARLLGNIPRLEQVQEILKGYPRPFRAEAGGVAEARVVSQGAQLLKVAVDFDSLALSEGMSPGRAVATMQGRTGQYDPYLLEALAAIRGGEQVAVVREVPLSALKVGMVLAEDVKTLSGLLLAGCGYTVGERFLECVRNLPPDSVRKGSWQVTVPPEG